jgi:hypothetical protein
MYDGLSSKNGCGFLLLVSTSLATGIIVFIQAYLLFTLPTLHETYVDPTSSAPALRLPTAQLNITTTNIPLAPLQVTFVAREPIRGFVDCEEHGFRGVVRTVNNENLAGVQVVLWKDEIQLVAMETTDVSGIYQIKVPGKPASPKFWIQLYQADRPVSAPLLLEIQPDCQQQGYQIYQIDWQESG